MTRPMSQYKDIFAGRPAAILGGGPSLPADVARLPAGGCVLIMVNFHALRLPEGALPGPIQFMVYNDHPESSPELLEAAQNAPKTITKVSPNNESSDVVFDVESSWVGFYSSNLATWFALWCGCDPVILCGMDCYQGEAKYFHEYEDKPHFHYPLAHHINPWIEDARNSCPHPERIKAMSGPLMGVFGQYEAAR